MQTTLAPINRIPNGAWLAVHEAERECAAASRYLRPRLVDALYRSTSAQHHFVGLAAYALWLEELRGEHDTDWLHL